MKGSRLRTMKSTVAVEILPDKDWEQVAYLTIKGMAVGEGFEPSLGLYTLNRFSKPAPSATRPPHRARQPCPLAGYVRGGPQGCQHPVSRASEVSYGGLADQHDEARP